MLPRYSGALAFLLPLCSNYADKRTFSFDDLSVNELEGIQLLTLTDETYVELLPVYYYAGLSEYSNEELVEFLHFALYPLAGKEFAWFKNLETKKKRALLKVIETIYLSCFDTTGDNAFPKTLRRIMHNFGVDEN